jgi:3-hydroxyacyl-[acyl-carrier protein] dehydratase/trans-2-decenoyl-[acyl-carrier protein] isomerase
VKYADFRARASFEKQELLAFAHGNLVEDGPEGFVTRLPLPPMLMLDRIVEISRNGPPGGSSRSATCRSIRFFQSHLGDPVQPGCLELAASWLLLGFFCRWGGGLGSGRGLGGGEVEFSGQIRPHDQLVRMEVEVRRYAELRESGSTIAIGDARLLVDGEEIYTIKRAKTGLFRDIAYREYPNPSSRSRGGKMER